MSAENDSSVIS